MPIRRSIVIVGGGFAGTSVARTLAGRRPDDVDLTLLSEESCTTFNPMLPQAVRAVCRVRRPPRIQATPRHAPGARLADDSR